MVSTYPTSGYFGKRNLGQVFGDMATNGAGEKVPSQLAKTKMRMDRQAREMGADHKGKEGNHAVRSIMQSLLKLDAKKNKEQNAGKMEG